MRCIDCPYCNSEYQQWYDISLTVYYCKLQKVRDKYKAIHQDKVEFINRLGYAEYKNNPTPLESVDCSCVDELRTKLEYILRKIMPNAKSSD